jgi:hypothetical protein
LGFVQKELSEFVVFGSGFAINPDTCFPALPIVSNALDVEEVTSYCGSNKAKIQSVTYMGKRGKPKAERTVTFFLKT